MSTLAVSELPEPERKQIERDTFDDAMNRFKAQDHRWILGDIEKDMERELLRKGAWE